MEKLSSFIDQFAFSEQDTRYIYKRYHWNFQSSHQKADVSTKLYGRLFQHSLVAV